MRSSYISWASTVARDSTSRASFSLAAGNSNSICDDISAATTRFAISAETGDVELSAIRAAAALAVALPEPVKSSESAACAWLSRLAPARSSFSQFGLLERRVVDSRRRASNAG